MWFNASVTQASAALRVTLICADAFPAPSSEEDAETAESVIVAVTRTAPKHGVTKLIAPPPGRTYVENKACMAGQRGSSG